jgi:hypothetical protein
VAKKQQDTPVESDSQTYNTTDEDFQLFVDETRYWVDRFQLADMEITMENTELDEDVRAACSVDMDSCNVINRLQSVWPEPPLPGEIERAAFHEVMEAFLCGIWGLATQRYITEREIVREKHKIIKTLENIIWKEDYTNRKAAKVGGKNKK